MRTMERGFARVVLLTLALGLLPGLAAAHVRQPGDTPGPYKYGETVRPSASPAMAAVPDPAFVPGRCTADARAAMPASAAHDHADSLQHRFACGARSVFYDDLKDELGARRDVVLTEMDVEGDRMAITVAYPESGFLLYDVSDASRPQLLSWYRSAQCERAFVEPNCGAFVDLAPDGRTVYLSKQALSYSPVLPPDEHVLASRPVDQQAVEVVDVSDPRAPRLRQIAPVPGVIGVHTARSFDVPAAGGAGPREPGRYVAAAVPSVGIALLRETADGLLAHVGLLRVDDNHDTFIQEDPLTRRTFLYVAMGFDSGFIVYDITAPTAPVALAEWDITPQCELDWYAHTIDVTTYEGRRIVTVPVETFDGTAQSAADQAEGCGATIGNGDFAGPMFFVDATDLSKLARPTPIDDEAAETAGGEVQRRSEAALITSWANPAGRAGGTFVFTPHNQQIDGTRVLVSQYHGGAVVLDAKAAFEGRRVRPKEIALASPGEASVRPQPPKASNLGIIGSPYMTSISAYRPWAWDAFLKDGHVLIPDGSGGLSSYEVLPGG